MPIRRIWISLYVDVIWLGMFKDHLLDLNSLVPENEVKAHFASATGAARLDGQTAGHAVLHRHGLDVLSQGPAGKIRQAATETWDEMTTTAKEIQDGERKAGNAEMWGYRGRDAATRV